MTNQYHMQRNADQRVLNLCKAFHEMVTHPTNPITKADLEKLIEKRPDVYGQFSSWLTVLK